MTAGRAVRFGRAPLVSGLAALVALGAAMVLMPQGWRETLRENGLDRVLMLDGLLRRADEVRPQPPVVIVDIDRRSLERLGAWPLPRAVIARLIEAIAAAKPRVIVIDVLFADADTRSPAGLARRLGETTGRRDLAELAEHPAGRGPADGGRHEAGACRARLRARSAADGGGPARPHPDARPAVTAGHLGGARCDRTRKGRRSGGGRAGCARLAGRLGRHRAPRPPARERRRRAPPGPGIGGRAGRRERQRLSGSVRARARSHRRSRAAAAADALLRLVPTGSGGRAHRKVTAVDLLDGGLAPGMLSGAIVLVGSSAPKQAACARP